MKKISIHPCHLVLFFLFFFFYPFFTISAQKVSIDLKGDNRVSDTISKKIVDYASIRIIYRLEIQPNPLDTHKRKVGNLCFQIGKNYLQYIDYNSLMGDSISDADARAGVSMGASFGKLMGYIPLVNDEVLVDLRNKRVMHTNRIGVGHTYRYQEDLPKLKWNLVEGDSTILDFECKKATLHYRGRDYVAWYTPSIAMPYGPYLFYGLPGLIFEIHDTKRHYQFALNGLDQINYVAPIYYDTSKKIEPITREEAHKIERNYCADPAKYIMACKSIKMDPKDLLDVKPLPYNPLELE